MLFVYCKITPVDGLVRLHGAYPFVEFGILVSESSSNRKTNNRFPDLTVLKKLKNKGLALSCHACGKTARDIVQKHDWSGLLRLVGKDFDIFQRCQLNVSGVKSFSENIEFPDGKDFIIQLKDDTRLYDFYKARENVFGFQDNSGGLGAFEDNWMDSDSYFGYAGGLSEQNVESVIEDLLIVNDADFWIDMESSVRTDDWFDLAKCERVLKLCAKYV